MSADDDQNKASEPEGSCGSGSGQSSPASTPRKPPPKPKPKVEPPPEEPRPRKKKQPPPPPRRQSYKPPKFRFISRGDDRPILLGVGTAGIGSQSNHEDEVRLAYRDWKLRKDEVAANEPRTAPTILTPRDAERMHQQRAKQTAAEREALQREQAFEEFQRRHEAKAERAHVRDEQLAALHAEVQRFREHLQSDRPFRSMTVSPALTEEHAEARRQDREELQTMKAFARQVREEERQRVLRAKEVWATMHQQAVEASKQARDERNKFLREVRQAEDARLQRWRERLQTSEDEKRAVARRMRQELEDEQKKAKAALENRLIANIEEMKAESEAAREQAAARREEDDLELRRQIKRVKKDQRSRFAERFEELLHERGEAAQHIREERKRLKAERKADQEARLASVRETKEWSVSRSQQATPAFP